MPTQSPRGKLYNLLNEMLKSVMIKILQTGLLRVAVWSVCYRVGTLLPVAQPCFCLEKLWYHFLYQIQADRGRTRKQEDSTQ